MNKNSSKPVSQIEKKVMDQIKTGQVKMRPKIFYSILGILGALTILLFGFVNAYFMSVVTLWMRLQVAQGPAYGVKRNLANLVGTFPWWALLLGLASLVIAVIIIRKVGSLYKIRLAYLIIFVVVVSLVSGFTFSFSALPNAFNRHNPICGVSKNEINSPPRLYY